MPEPKIKQVMCNLEVTLYLLLVEAAGNNISLSGYLRNLIINDLYKQHLLTDDAMKAMLTGEQCHETIK